jgi:hypothetical protein
MATAVFDATTSEQDVPIEDNLGDELDPIPYNYSLTSYGADYPVDGLVKRISEGDIYIPSFQRSYVWNVREASRFVESAFTRPARTWHLFI